MHTILATTGGMTYTVTATATPPVHGPGRVTVYLGPRCSPDWERIALVALAEHGWLTDQDVQVTISHPAGAKPSGEPLALDLAIILAALSHTPGVLPAGALDGFDAVGNYYRVGARITAEGHRDIPGHLVRDDRVHIVPTLPEAVRVLGGDPTPGAPSTRLDVATATEELRQKEADEIAQYEETVRLAKERREAARVTARYLTAAGLALADRTLHVEVKKSAGDSPASWECTGCGRRDGESVTVHVEGREHAATCTAIPII